MNQITINTTQRGNPAMISLFRDNNKPITDHFGTTAELLHELLVVHCSRGQINRVHLKREQFRQDYMTVTTIWYNIQILMHQRLLGNHLN